MFINSQSYIVVSDNSLTVRAKAIQVEALRFYIKDAMS